MTKLRSVFLATACLARVRQRDQNDNASGACVPQAVGFDEFTPVQCETVEVDQGDLSSLNFCNWT